jgi:hypothetical protein
VGVEKCAAFGSASVPLRPVEIVCAPSFLAGDLFYSFIIARRQKACLFLGMPCWFFCASPNLLFSGHSLLWLNCCATDCIPNAEEGRVVAILSKNKIKSEGAIKVAKRNSAEVRGTNECFVVHIMELRSCFAYNNKQGYVRHSQCSFHQSPPFREISTQGTNRQGKGDPKSRAKTAKHSRNGPRLPEQV